MRVIGLHAWKGGRPGAQHLHCHTRTGTNRIHVQFNDKISGLAFSPTILSSFHFFGSMLGAVRTS